MAVNAKHLCISEHLNGNYILRKGLWMWPSFYGKKNIGHIHIHTFLSYCSNNSNIYFSVKLCRLNINLFVTFNWNVQLFKFYCSILWFYDSFHSLMHFNCFFTKLLLRCASNTNLTVYKALIKHVCYSWNKNLDLLVWIKF